jgi:hypothetical protein
MNELPDNAVRNDLLALMLATEAFSDAEMIAATGLSPQHVDSLRRSPLFVESVRRYRERIGRDGVRGAQADLEADARDNVRFIREAREGKIADDPRALRIRMAAATALLERQVPKAANENDSNTSVKIVIDARSLERIERATHEARVVSEIPRPALSDGSTT